jgi:hypothetical protein
MYNSSLLASGKIPLRNYRRGQGEVRGEWARNCRSFGDGAGYDERGDSGIPMREALGKQNNLGYTAERAPRKIARDQDGYLSIRLIPREDLR